MQRLVVPEEMKVGRIAQKPTTTAVGTIASTAGRIIRIICWLMVIGGVGGGGLILVTGMTAARSAPQEAVVVSLALACAILPYCFARAITEITRDS